MTFELRSKSFPPNGKIPPRFTGEGEDDSPELEWHNVPSGTEELALLCEDPDAPGKDPWVHWVAFGLDPSHGKIPAGESQKPPEERTAMFVEGQNSWDRVGYGGPLPPPGHGPHRYIFTLYALDRPLDLKPGATKNEMLSALHGHVIGEAKLTGTYARW